MSQPSVREDLFIPVIITIVFIIITIINFGEPCDQRFSLAWVLALKKVYVRVAYLSRSWFVLYAL